MSARELLYRADLGDRRYRNPILFADYSDPDVIRVGDTYYLTASSFNYTPGLPILTSRDLVNWQLVNYALKNIPEERYAIPRHSEGVWAPSIRYHDGLFYIYYGMPDEGIYVVRTDDPLGEWDAPVCVLPGKGLIDSCPLWDDDGRVYLIHAYARSRIGFKSILGMFELSPDGLSAISEDHFIYDGNRTIELTGAATDEERADPAQTIEGPKVYKRNGYYYIWAPAGGVRPGWQLVMRSRSLTGGWETRIVMHQGDTVVNGPHQGGLVDTPEGEEFFIHFQDRGLYGRICHLQPVSRTVDDWPVIGRDMDGSGVGVPVDEWRKPAGAPEVERVYLQSSDEFEGGRIGLQWQWLGNSREDFAGAIPDRDSGIRLLALSPSGESSPVLWRSANVLTQKLVVPEFVTDVEMDMTGLMRGDRAGVVMTGAQYTALCVERGEDSDRLLLVESEGGDNDKTERVLQSIPAEDIAGAGSRRIGRVTLRMDFRTRDAGEPVQYLADALLPTESQRLPVLHMLIVCGDRVADSGCAFTPSDHTWVGAKTGVFCVSSGEAGGHADVLSVRTQAGPVTA